MFGYLLSLVAAVGVFVVFRVCMFKHEQKRNPADLRDFFDYRMRKLSVVLGAVYCLIVLMIFYPKSPNSYSQINLLHIALLALFSSPFVYLGYLARKGDKQDF